MSARSPLFAFSAAHLATVHASLVYAAFATALAVGIGLHYQKICTNEWYGPPQEWMPSVSATIGDRYPERALFQILIAACVGPRLCVVGLWYIMSRRATSRLPLLVFVAGMIRCFSAVTWMMVTSGDDHDTHDIAMFVFLFATPLWMGGSLSMAPKGSPSRRWKKYAAIGFFGSIPPMIYLFIQHKVYQKAGAYSRYAYFEWNLILSDVAFDASFLLDFARLKITIVDTTSTKPKEPLVEEACAEAVKTVDALKWRDVAAFASESILGYCFFTTMTALAPCIFFVRLYAVSLRAGGSSTTIQFNVYSMGMAGQEALLLTHLAVILVAIRPFRTFAARHAAIFQLLSLCGLVGYRDDYESHRLAYMSVATALQTFTYASMWHGARDKPAVLEFHGRALGVGIIGTVVAKLANHSLNPAWPFVDHRSGGQNAVLLTFAAIACLEKLTRPSPPSLVSTKEMKGRTSVASAIGFGALMFALHQFLADSGSIIARTWSGYPIRGPVAIPHGAFVVLAMAIGFSLPLSPTLHVAGLVGLAILMGAHTQIPASSKESADWIAFGGGLIFAAFVTSALTPFLRSIASQPRPALAFATAFLVYDLFVLADVWTVAYAFVPVGWLLREKTKLVNLALVLALTPATYSARRLKSVSTPRSKWMLLIALSGLVAVASSASAFRLQRAMKPKPYFADQRILTAGIWTVHFGMDGWMWESQRRMQALFSDAQLDVVGLLESDLHRIVFGNRDLTQYIAETLGYYVDMGPGPQQHTWGATLFSKFPIINSTHHLLPSPSGELAPAIHATLDVYDTLVDVIVAHNGQEEDPHDRELQSTYMGKLMRDAYPRPFIFLGYVVTKPQAPKPAPYWLLVEDGKMLDIDPTDTDRWCEYILFRGLRKLAYARITRGSLPSVTDTELQTARFIVEADALDPDVDVTGNRRAPAHTVPTEWRYSEKFDGAGTRGHRYHVLGNGNEALYYRQEVLIL